MARAKKFQDTWFGQVVDFLKNEAAAWEYMSEVTARGRPMSFITGSYESWLDEQALRERTKLKRALKEARKQRFLEMRVEGNKFMIKFTNDGIVELLKESVRSIENKLPQGYVCLVLFDFPVAANTSRKFWRRFLKSAKFEQAQLSCWQTERDIVEPLTELVDRLEAGKWISIYIARRINTDNSCNKNEPEK